MIVLRDCTKILKTGKRKTLVLDQVNLAFPRDGTTVVLGVKGSGKTTFIRLLSGTMNPTSGSVHRAARVSFPLGFMGYFPLRQRARQVVRHIASIYGEDARTILAFLERLPGFDDILDEEMIDLPGPMKLTLAYATGYALNFDMYMMDTGIAVGTPLFRRLCETFYAERRRTAGIVLATSSAATARKLADRIMILEGGRLETFASNKDALERFSELTAKADLN